MSSFKANTLQPPYFKAFQAEVAYLEQHPDSHLHLELEAFENFSCTQCGDCCKLPWKIEVSKSYHQTWYEVFDQHPSGKFKDPFPKLDELTEHSYAAIRRQPGSSVCIFLEDDNSCFIHNNYGVEALARVCQVYPRIEKAMGHQYRTRYLLNSCQAVPETIENFPHLLVRRESSDSPLKLGYQMSEHTGRLTTYLWLGLCLDLLEKKEPQTLISRWRLLLPTLHALNDWGIEKVTPAQMEGHYYELMQRSQFPDLAPPDSKRIEQALAWTYDLLPQYPNFHVWLRQIVSGELNWPHFEAEEQEILDRYLQVFFRNRLLAIPYLDYFIGKANLWQQMLILALQALALQWLCLYFRHRYGEFNKALAIRAMNTVGSSLEQKQNFLHAFKMEEISAEQCLRALETALSIDFAGPQIR